MKYARLLLAVPCVSVNNSRIMKDYSINISIAVQVLISSPKISFSLNRLNKVYYAMINVNIHIV